MACHRSKSDPNDTLQKTFCQSVIETTTRRKRRKKNTKKAIKKLFALHTNAKIRNNRIPIILLQKRMTLNKRLRNSGLIFTKKSNLKPVEILRNE